VGYNLPRARSGLLALIAAAAAQDEQRQPLPHAEFRIAPATKRTVPRTSNTAAATSHGVAVVVAALQIRSSAPNKGPRKAKSLRLTYATTRHANAARCAISPARAGALSRSITWRERTGRGPTDTAPQVEIKKCHRRTKGAPPSVRSRLEIRR
jgi:hypothetical protein